MGIKINFDAAGNPVKPTFVLTTRSGNRLGLITGISDEKISNPLMENPELTFTVTKSISSKNWDFILDFKLVYCPEWDAWFEIKVELDDADATIKYVTGKGLCQAELSQILVHGLEFNTEDDIARDDYERSIIYNFQNPNASVLHGIFQKAPHYKLVHVDASIAEMQKTLTFDGVSIQDALNEIEQECHCIIIYNNSANPNTNLPAREVSIYDLETICNDCGHRGEYSDFCPECDSTNIKYGYGNDTRIYVSKDNLTDAVKYYVDVDQVKNCFKLVAGDDVMTSAIQACNPNGTDYIWYISDTTKEDMPPELVEKINSYDILYDYYSKEHVTVINEDILNEYNALVEKYKPYNKDLVKIEDANIVGYSALMNIIYDVIDFNAFLQTSLMPIDDTVNDTTAEKQAALLTNESLSPIALSSVSEYSEEIINQMILAVARIIIDNRYDVKIKTSQIFINENEEDDRKHQWVGTFTVTNYADSDLTADTGNIIIFINKDYDTYIRQKVEKVLDDTDVEDYSISNLLKLEKTLDEFKVSIKPYNISVLLNLKDACDTCLDTLQAESIGNQTLWKDTDGVDMYEKYYLNYYNKLEALVDEIEAKTREQKIIGNLREFITNERNKIQEALNFENYLGEELWLIFCSYRREDIYKNENYISDNLSNAEIFENAREFYEIARKEIFKSATLQHRISSTLKNLLAIPEFEPLRDSFELGNWIRIEVDGEIYRLRLIKYEIDFDNLEELNVEFSDCTKTSDGVTDVNSLLSKTASMATSYGGVKRQATKGNDSYLTVSDWFNNGLNATLTRIMDSSETQDVVIDKHGILIRDYDPVTESYWPEQMKFINRTLAITTDNWRTLVTAIGSFIYQDPISKEYLEGYGINAETVIGNLILGSRLGIYNASASMCFDENGLWIYNDTNSFRVNPNSDVLLSLSKDDEKIFWVDENGMLHIAGDGAGLDITANSSVTGLQSQLKVTSDEIKASVEDTKNSLSAEISETASNIRLELQDTASGLDSKIDMTASSIRQEVTDYKDGLESSISQTATEIRSEISSTREGLESSISQTATEIQTQIADLDSGLNSKIDQTASAIRQEVTDGDAKLQSSITETASAIRSEVKDIYDGLSTDITETAAAIRAEAKSQYEGLNASLEIQAGQIESLVAADEGLESKITQTYDTIHAEVKNIEMDLSAEITILSDSITNEVTRAKDEEEQIWSKVNQTATSLEVQIQNSEKWMSDLSNTIDMTVDYTNSQIDALLINARNLAYATSSEWEDYTLTQSEVDTENENIYVINSHIGLADKGIKVGDTITVHFDAKFSEDFAKINSSKAKITLLLDKNPTGTAQYIYNSSTVLLNILSSTSREGHIKFSFTVTDDMLTLTPYLLLTVKFDYYSGTFWWKNLMAEVGTTESPYVKAPEDVGVNFYDVQTVVKQNKEDIILQASRADDHEARITVNADKIDFVVTGDKTSGFSLTENAITLTAEQINAKGMITFSGLSEDAQAKIEACVLSSEPLYALSDSNTTAPGDDAEWTNSVDWDYVKNSTNFVWQLMETKYGDGTTSRTSPVCISDGKEIVSIKPQYYLHTSSTSAPSGVSWSDTCPSYVSGKYIWTRNYITYSDGTTKTTTPVYDSGLTKTNQEILDKTGASVTTDYHSVYYSSTEPAAPHVVGDVWYETSGSTVKYIKVWTSSGAWSTVENGQTTIANGSIVANLIASDAITADKFAGNELKSLNYVAGAGFASSGMRIDLSTGEIRTPCFVLGYESGRNWLTFNGEINMTSAIIGGFSVTSTDLCNGYSYSNSNSIGMSTGSNGIAFWACGGSYNVNTSGYITTPSITVTGSSSTICGFTFNKSNGHIKGSTHCIIESDTCYVGLFSGEKMFRTSTGYDAQLNLGASGARWLKVYASSDTISTSDERDKNIIGCFDDRHKQLFMKLKPIIFTWKNANIDTNVHFGLGAQTTEQQALDCNISNSEIGAINHDYWEEPNPNDGRTDRYGMAYNEIHMLTIPVVQEHERKLLTYDDKFTSLENELETVKTQLSEAQETIELLQQTIEHLTVA